MKESEKLLKDFNEFYRFDIGFLYSEIRDRPQDIKPVERLQPFDSFFETKP